MKNIAILFSLTAFLLLYTNAHAEKTILINEVMATCDESAKDENYDSPDWLELYNASTQPVNLKNWRISDSPDYAQAWQFPDTTVNPDEHILVFASGNNRASSDLYAIEAAGSGFDKYANNDGFRYHYIPISGDFEMQIRVNSLRKDKPNGYVGLMLREELNPESLFAALFAMYPQKDDGLFMFREQGDSDLDQFNTFYGLTYPYCWLRIQRQGDSVFGWVCNDGWYWLRRASIYYPLRNNIYVGIALTSADINKPATAALSELSLNGNPLPFENLIALNIGNQTWGKSGYSRELHLNFKLNSDGESLYLWDNKGNLIDDISYSAQNTDISYGRQPDGSDVFKYFYPSSPCEKNTDGFIGYTPEPKFSIEGGWFDSPIYFTLSCGETDARIYYTLNSSDPVDTCALYEGETIYITKTTVVRARAYSEGHLRSKSVTYTFFIADSTKLPVISISSDSINIFDEEKGIFSEKNMWPGFEIPASFEFWDKNKELGFSSNAGIKIQGVVTRLCPQKSLKISSRSKYESKEFNYKFFGENSFDSYNKLLLRNAGNEWNESFMRDAYIGCLVDNLPSLDVMKYQPCLVYINGNYWGILNLRERFEEDYLSYKYNIPKDSITLIEYEGKLITGQLKDYMLLYDTLTTIDMTKEESYDFVDKRLDINNIMDYTITEIFSGNHDWPWNNIKYWNSKSYDGKWRWALHDLDWTLAMWGAVPEKNILEIALHPDSSKFSFMVDRFLKNEKFKNLFINRFADLMNTNFLVDRMLHILDSLANNIAPEIPRHQEKWAGSAINWDVHIGRIRFYVSKRPGYQREHIIGMFGLSGTSDVLLDANNINAGSIRISTIKPDSLPWKGIYFQDVPVTIEAIPSVGYKFAGWANPELPQQSSITLLLPDTIEFKAIFVPDNDDEKNIVINEIMHKPSSSDDSKDWIELYNKSKDKEIDISNWFLKDSDDGHCFTIPNNTIMKPEEYLVICGDSNKFKISNPSVINYFGNVEYGFGSPDQIRIFNREGNLIDSVSYQSTAPWPIGSDGTGRTLELINPQFDNAKPENWQVSLVLKGTPELKNSSTLSIPEDYIIDMKNYPNPFNNITTIEYFLEREMMVNISLYDSEGNKISNIVNNKIQKAGMQKILFDGSLLPSAIYFLKIEIIEPQVKVKILPLIILH